jgi:hypothetical protein
MNDCGQPGITIRRHTLAFPLGGLIKTIPRRAEREHPR